MTQKEKVLFLARLINDNSLYPDRVLIYKMGFGYIATDSEKNIVLDGKTVKVLEKHFKEIIVVDIDGSGVVEFSEFSTGDYYLNTKWLTPEQACNYLQISMSYLNQLVKEGRIPVYSPDRKIRRFKLEDLDSFMEHKPKRKGKVPREIKIV